MTHDELRNLAEAATPGLWQNAPDGFRVFDIFDERKHAPAKLICRTANNPKTRTFANRANADFIAAANPKTVLELLDRIAELEGAEKRRYEDVAGGGP